MKKETEKSLHFSNSHNIMTKQPKGVMSVSEARKLILNEIKNERERCLEIIDNFIKDYGYCDCNLEGKDFHMSVVKDFERLKKFVKGEKDEINR